MLVASKIHLNFITSSVLANRKGLQRSFEYRSRYALKIWLCTRTSKWRPGRFELHLYVASVIWFLRCFWIWRLLFYDMLEVFPITYLDWFCDVFIIYMRILFWLLCRKWFQSIPKFWWCWSACSIAKSCKYTCVQYTRSFKYTCFQCKLVLFSIYFQ